MPGGCHDQACGFIELGTVTTDSTGQGVFSITLPDGNPYPSQYVHLDIGQLQNIEYTTTVYDQVFPAVDGLTLAAETLSADGDPTD